MNSVDSELFRTKDGIGPERTTANSPDGFLALVKDQTEDHLTKKQATDQAVEQVVAQAADQLVEQVVAQAAEQASPEEQSKCFVLCTSDSDINKTDPWDDRKSDLPDPPDEDEDNRTNTPPEEFCHSSPPQDLNTEDNVDIVPVIPPTWKKCLEKKWSTKLARTEQLAMRGQQSGARLQAPNPKPRQSRNRNQNW